LEGIQALLFPPGKGGVSFWPV